MVTDPGPDGREGSRRRPARLAVAAALLLVGIAAARAQDSARPDWPAVKCQRYQKAWADLLAQRGPAGLGRDFLERHDAFIASGCTARADVCPRSPQELEVANILSLKAMNAGMTGSFLPFACRAPS